MTSIDTTRAPDRETDIAIVGMAARFPGAPDVSTFARHLRDGIESVIRFSEDDLRASGVDPQVFRRPSYVAAGAILEDAELFDAAFFGLSPSEAILADPQQRLFLECVWEALEDAACDPERTAGAIGVYAGTGATCYRKWLEADATLRDASGGLRIMIGNDADFLTTRASFLLNLRGPSLTVQTACSTSLVAVHLACQSLLSGECDLAIAGGSSVPMPQRVGYEFQEGGILSPDGHCRAFDARAQGCVRGSGVGVVSLKRLRDAIADRDRIYACIKGTAINSDGAGKAGYTSPGQDGQARVIAEALAVANIDPDTIRLIEAHGTGTPVGDPIEIEALTRVFGKGTSRTHPCALGSVKTNIGHLGAAAGVAGLIKTVIAVHQRFLPASLHFERPNRSIDFAATPFVVHSTSQPWESASYPRRAGVSSFGIGGTNAHVVLEEAPEPVRTATPRREQIIVLSARTPESLSAAAARLGDRLRDAPELPIADVSHTLQIGRRAFQHRLAFVATDSEAARTFLHDATRVERSMSTVARPREPLTMLFPGQGAQYGGMGAYLYREEPRFRETVDRCCEILGSTGREIHAAFFASTPDLGSEQAWMDTAYAQPALFVVEYALSELYKDWGIRPDLMIGHSVGEYVAACIAGVLTLEDALRLIGLRARLMHDLPTGAMVAVALSEREVSTHMRGGLAIAAINAPNSTVLSGTHDEIRSLTTQLDRDAVVYQPVRASHAFHSAIMDPVIEEFGRAVAKVALRPPSIPFLSNLTGQPLAPADATSPDYWAGHLRKTVRFADCAETALGMGHELFLEVGPGRALTTSIRRHPRWSSHCVTATSLPSAHEQTSAVARILESIGTLWCRGVNVEWSRATAMQERQCVTLPTYPFQKQRYLAEMPRNGSAEAMPSAQATIASASAAIDREPEQISYVNQREAPLSSMNHGSAAPVLRTEIGEIFGRLLGVPGERLDPSLSFVELGADSLLLMQASRALHTTYGVDIPFRTLLHELRTLDAVAVLVQGTASERRLESRTPAPVFAPSTRTTTKAPAAAFATTSAPAPTSAVPATFGPYKPARRDTNESLTPRQQQYLAEFIAGYNARTASSKSFTETFRPVLSDNRVSAGFHPLLKELIYPIVSTRAEGSRIWDVDGHEYVDFTMGFGVHLFGHSPAFVLEAMRRQLSQGAALGPQPELIGRVAQTICRLTGMERVTFCNTGTEAVMTALRVARTVTQRTRVAMFTGSYHGTFDGVLGRRGASGDVVPIAPGIPSGMVDDLVILEYDDEQSLEYLRAHAHDFAAVLVEPIQSRRPDRQPKTFLQALRAITRQSDTALIFDEIVTGFRFHLGGAQALFDVRADIATYGKVLGGGFPIGVIAGTKAYMDTIDGGTWRFGDSSFPSAPQTMFAGTFSKHPLAIAVADAVLTRLIDAGPRLQEELNEATEALATRLRELVADYGAPFRVLHGGTILRIVGEPGSVLTELFFYHLVQRGVYLWEGRSAFISTAHSRADLDRFVDAARETLDELRRGGFIAERIDVDAPPSPRPPVEVPLTAAQRNLWVHAQLGAQQSLAYNQVIALRLLGDLDVDALRHAVRSIVARHDALRATFPTSDMQLIVDMSIDVPVVDARASYAASGEQAIEALLTEEGSRSFDLASGPLIRVMVAEVEDEHALVFITVHHLIADGWSLGVLMHELGEVYSAQVQGRHAELTRPMQFSEYATNAARGDLDALARRIEAEWRSVVAVAPPVTLPSTRTRTPTPGDRGGRAEIAINATTLGRLRRLSSDRGCTLFVTLLTGFTALMHRVSGLNEFILGVLTARRDSTTGWALVGNCVDVVPFHCRLDVDQTFASLLNAIDASWERVHVEPLVSIGKWLEAVDRSPDTVRAPKIAVTFNQDSLQPGATSEAFNGVRAEVIDTSPQFARFDLAVDVAVRQSGLVVKCEYDAALYDAGAIERMLQRYRQLLESVSTRPTDAIWSLPVLLPAERSLRHDPPMGEVAPPSSTERLHELFAAQARRTPLDVAIVSGADELTYAELRARSHVLSRRLRRLGVAPEQRVAICLERGIDLPVTLLAVLEAGGCYVPLDPSYPADRLQYVLKDSGAGILVTHAGLRERLQLDAPIVVCLDQHTPLGESEPSTDLVIEPDAIAIPGNPDNAAYVIYTSGSTGRPKGVVIPHRSAVHVIRAMLKEGCIRAGDTFLSVTSIGFDIALAEIFGPLACGAKLVVATAAELANPHAVIRRASAVGATALQATPTLWRMLVDVGVALPSLRVLSGGEALTPALAKSLRQWFGPVWNLYGPTETTVWSASHCPRDAETPMPIGRPLGDTCLHVLDGRLQPVVVEAIGELYIGGAGVARGYWGKPALTAERFVPDPFAVVPGARMFRTGDVARWLASGLAECLGRTDHQVKIRGHRVELGEIEAVVAGHEHVRECAVAVWPAGEDAAGEVVLGCYVTPRATVPAELDLAEDVRTQINQLLPRHMAPSFIVVLDRLPQTPNGKVDRAALPRPDPASSQATHHVAPTNEIEESLAATWAELLRVERVGIRDDFFTLGGHSLIAARIAARLRRTYGVGVTADQVLRHPTVEAFAVVLADAVWEKVEAMDDADVAHRLQEMN